MGSDKGTFSQMYFVYLKDEIRAQIFQEMPKADCAVLPKESTRDRSADRPLVLSSLNAHVGVHDPSYLVRGVEEGLGDPGVKVGA